MLSGRSLLTQMFCDVTVWDNLWDIDERQMPHESSMDPQLGESVYWLIGVVSYKVRGSQLLIRALFSQFSTSSYGSMVLMDPFSHQCQLSDTDIGFGPRQNIEEVFKNIGRYHVTVRRRHCGVAGNFTVENYRAIG